MKTITIEEAINQGYTLAGVQGRDWQQGIPLAELNSEDLKLQVWCPFSKEFRTPGMDEESIKEMIADAIETNWSEDTGDDTEEVYKLIISVDFQPLLDKIKEKVKEVQAFSLHQRWPLGP